MQCFARPDLAEVQRITALVRHIRNAPAGGAQLVAAALQPDSRAVRVLSAAAAAVLPFCSSHAQQTSPELTQLAVLLAQALANLTAAGGTQACSAAWSSCWPSTIHALLSHASSEQHNPVRFLRRQIACHIRQRGWQTQITCATQSQAQCMAPPHCSSTTVPRLAMYQVSVRVMPWFL